MSGAIDASEPAPVTPVEISGGKGVQVGDHNTQHIHFVGNYIENQVIQPPPAPAGEVGVVVGDIPQEPKGYQPRADLWAELDAPLPHGRVSVVHAVTGMRGIGKTHLAAAYARARLAAGWRLVAWVNASDRATVLGGLGEVAAALGLNAAKEDAAQAAWAVRHRLETDGDRCLLVFDNATDPENLLPFIPAAGQARVLITSNEQSVAELGASVAVDVFTEQEALAFLAERTGSADTASAQLLAAELGCLPLALAQAAAVIAGQHLDYAVYLRRLRDKPVEELLLPTVAGQYPHGLAEAVLLSLDAVRTSDSAGVCSAVMDLMSVLSANGVPRALLHAAGQAGAIPGKKRVLSKKKRPGGIPPEVIDEALGQLAGSSLLTFSVDGETVAMHRLVMRVVRERLARQGRLSATCQVAAGTLEAQYGSLMRDRDAWREGRAGRECAEQIMAVREHSASCSGEAGRQLAQATLDLRWWALSFLSELGDSDAREIQLAESLLADGEQIHVDDYIIMFFRLNLATAYLNWGRVVEAIPLYERALADLERFHGIYTPILKSGNLNPEIQPRNELRPDTLIARNHLASAYKAAGRVDDAIALGERNLADCEWHFGHDRVNTCDARSNLASAYEAAGRVDEAIALFDRALADRERLLGPDHPHTIHLRRSLAGAYEAAGRVDEAIPLYERALGDLERVLGPNHPDTVASRDELAAARTSQC